LSRFIAAVKRNTSAHQTICTLFESNELQFSRKIFSINYARYVRLGGHDLSVAYSELATPTSENIQIIDGDLDGYIYYNENLVTRDMRLVGSGGMRYNWTNGSVDMSKDRVR